MPIRLGRGIRPRSGEDQPDRRPARGVLVGWRQGRILWEGAHVIQEGRIIMTSNTGSHVAHSVRGAALAVAACLAIGAAPPAAAQRPMTTHATLLDRVQIEELIVSYYYHLGTGDHKGFADYYTDDAVFDVNGKVYRGREAIQAVYDQGQQRVSPLRQGTTHMLLNNPLISVTGNTATAQFIWTGVMSDSVKGPPRLLEQGREYDVLVKQNGQWRITKRTIISDAALSNEFDAVYKPRKDYDPLKD